MLFRSKCTVTAGLEGERLATGRWVEVVDGCEDGVGVTAVAVVASVD